MFTDKIFAGKMCTGKMALSMPDRNIRIIWRQEDWRQEGWRQEGWRQEGWRQEGWRQNGGREPFVNRSLKSEWVWPRLDPTIRPFVTKSQVGTT
jgi:hypothetical protein